MKCLLLTMALLNAAPKEQERLILDLYNMDPRLVAEVVDELVAKFNVLVKDENIPGDMWVDGVSKNDSTKHHRSAPCSDHCHKNQTRKCVFRTPGTISESCFYEPAAGRHTNPLQHVRVRRANTRTLFVFHGSFRAIERFTYAPN